MEMTWAESRGEHHMGPDEIAGCGWPTESGSLWPAAWQRVAALLAHGVGAALGQRAPGCTPHRAGFRAVARKVYIKTRCPVKTYFITDHSL